MSEAALIVRRVAKYFGDFPALRNVSFEVSPGEIVGLLGRNGAGKTTMLNMLAGLSKPSEGVIESPGFPPGDEARRAIGVVGHSQWLYDDLTAEENLSFFGKLYNVSDADSKIELWLERVGLTRFRNSLVNEYSRGMRQRLALARAFLHEPRVLLLDEPWTALDDRAMELLSSLVVEARERGVAAVVCSHQLREALAISDRVALLDRGKIVWQGPCDDALRAAPETLYDRIS